MSLPTDIKSGAIFSQIQTGLSSYPDVAKEVAEETGKVFQFCIKGGAKPHYFIVNLSDAPSLKYSTSAGNADCTITMTDGDFVDLTGGKLDGMSAFMQGKLQIEGDMMAAQSFAPAIQRIRESVESGAGGAASSGGDSFPSDIKAAAVFKQIQDGLSAFPDLAKEVAEETGKVFQFEIKGGASPAFFIINLNNAPSCSFSGSKGDGDVTIKMADADFVDLVEGKLDGMSAFMQGKLQIEGDMMAAQAFAPAIQKIREYAEKNSKL